MAAITFDELRTLYGTYPEIGMRLVRYTYCGPTYYGRDLPEIGMRLVRLFGPVHPDEAGLYLLWLYLL